MPFNIPDPGLLSWGFDSVIVPDPVAAVIWCIVHGGQPADLEPLLMSVSAGFMAKAVQEFKLLEISMACSNLPFIKYFVSSFPVVPLRDHVPPYLMHLAIKHRARRDVLEHLAGIECRDNTDLGMLFLFAITRDLFDALDFLMDLVSRMPPSPRREASLRYILFSGLSSCDAARWLLSRGFTLDEPTKKSLFMAHFHDPEAVKWLVEKAKYVLDFNDAEFVRKVLTCSLGFSWLLKHLSVADIFSKAPAECAAGALALGDPAVLAQLPKRPFCGSSLFSLSPVSLYSEAAIGGVVSLNFVAARVPISAAVANAVMKNISYSGVSTESLRWFLLRDLISSSSMVSLVSAAMSLSFLQVLDFFAGMLATRFMFWTTILENIPYIGSIEVVLLLARHHADQQVEWRFPCLPNPVGILRGAIERSRTVPDLERLALIFDRLPSDTIFRYFPGLDFADRADAVRVWWQYQRAKLGVLIVSLRVLRAREQQPPEQQSPGRPGRPDLPPELYRALADWFLTGT
jgi:hypothetical protein